MWIVALQVRRVAEDDPVDSKFVFRRWADWQFLIVALRRLQRAAELAVTTPIGATFVAAALAQFRHKIPGLRTMRNVAEHIDSYAVDSPTLWGFNTPIARLHDCTGGVENDVRKDVSGWSRWDPKPLLGWNPNTTLSSPRAACPARVAAS
jgi:hypothetical protein